jgi:hypothetical protein
MKDTGKQNNTWLDHYIDHCYIQHHLQKNEKIRRTVGRAKVGVGRWEILGFVELMQGPDKQPAPQ